MKFLEWTGLLKRYFIPSEKVATLYFLKMVLEEKKKLLKIDNGTIFPKVPRVEELKAKNVWE